VAIAPLVAIALTQAHPLPRPLKSHHVPKNGLLASRAQLDASEGHPAGLKSKKESSKGFHFSQILLNAHQ